MRFPQKLLCAVLSAFVLLGVSRAADKETEPSTPFTLVDSASVNAAATQNSNEFFLGRSVNFAIEVLLESGTANYDLKVQFKDMAGTWRDDPDGDTATAATSTWNLYAISIPYWTRELRVALTNDDGSAATYSIRLHRDSGKRNK